MIGERLHDRYHIEAELGRNLLAWANFMVRRSFQHMVDRERVHIP